MFYRTNAQSRTFEEAFIRIGMPYKVVGGVRFYERREVRDAIAYLRAIANRADDVSLRRIVNVPKRGIGDRAEAAVADLAARESITFGDALRRVDEIPGLASRSANQLRAFAKFLDDHEAMVAQGMPADAILTSVLDRSGYLADLHGSTDPQDETRLENLKELITVAREFVTGVATLTVPGEDLDELGLPDSDAPPEGDLAAALDPEADLAAGAAEPDASLGAFLERVALVADSDQIPHAPDEADSGVVTLMTLHTAKGLEFDTVFLTGCEDGVFPISERLRSAPAASWRRNGGSRTSASLGRASGSTSLARSPGRPGVSPAQSAKSVPERGADSAGRLAAYRGRGHQLAQHLRDGHPDVAECCRLRCQASGPPDSIPGGWRQGAAHHVRHGHGRRHVRRRRQSHGRRGLWVRRTQAPVLAVCTAGEALAADAGEV